MDLILSFFQNNILTILSGAGLLIFGWKLIDFCLSAFLKNVNPLEFWVQFIDKFEENLMISISKKTPETAKIIHHRLIQFCDRLSEKLKEDSPN